MICAHRLAKIGVAFALLLTVGTPVQAGFTPVYTVPGPEPSHAEVLQAYFSPATTWSVFARSGGSGAAVDYTNGVLTALRMDDFGVEGVIDVGSTQVGQATDRVWVGGPVTVRAIGRFAFYNQAFGYDRSGGGEVDLFDVTGSGTAVEGSGVVNEPPQTSWRWTRSGTGTPASSDPDRNAGADDHLVTYRIEGLADGLAHWLLFWEDLEGLGDRDYNDLVVELTAPVPEPASLVLLALATLLRRR